MTKLQISQVIAVLLLGVYVIWSYSTNTDTGLMFYTLVGANFLLWIFRLRERRQT
ncbi:hypothetical protein [Bacillus sp. FJAT-45037]|uniref:hypothetical protein n=1 Tax=Bacillus sp. FJAT-45037 TaxID=2011007 RepID=UPI0018E1F536|nr:hypothetical protein [Bacillus sp. FJAT-45037]